MKSFFSSVLMAALCLGSFVFASCDPKDKTPDPLTFSETKVEVEAGKVVEVSVKNGTQPFTAKSSDEKATSVKVEKEKIIVTGVAAGTATINVTDSEQAVGAFTVEVKAAAEKLEFDKAEVAVAVEKEAAVTVKSGTAPYSVTVKDNAVATASVNESTITVKGIKAGSTTVTVTDKDGKTGDISIKVE